ncbi:MAG: repeat-containing protein [Verrucomicrobiales bacterium]|nr:repeat-containing protein [Verrucomicrobiales bacterium]
MVSQMVFIRKWFEGVPYLVAASVFLLQTVLFKATAAQFVVSSVADGGAGSLRAAITGANGQSGPHSISFSIPGSGVRQILLQTGLPAITQPVTIDGTTQPGFNAFPLIQLDGTFVTDYSSGLKILSGNCVVRGLNFVGFGGEGIRLDGAGNNRVEGNHIGFRSSDGTLATNWLAGIAMIGSANNVIGGTTPGSRNIISGNAVGVYIGGGSYSNAVLNNYIGTTPNGTSILANNGVGILIESAYGNQIGGTNLNEGNLISGNAAAGILLSSRLCTNNVILGNLIGVDATGTAGLANSLDGVVLNDAAFNQIGNGTTQGRNIISGNVAAGVAFLSTNCTGNRISGNYIGVSASGLVKISNGDSGVVISSAPGNIVGGTTSGYGNVISGNSNGGIIVGGDGADNNIIQGNIIGANATGTAAIGNFGFGMNLVAGTNTLIGGSEPLAGNLISGNTRAGIQAIVGANRILIKGNKVGTDISGKQAIPNASFGIAFSTAGNQIGGTNSNEGNLISGNNDYGIYFTGASATNNLLAGNTIGTDVSGTVALANRLAGIGMSDCQGNTIGGTSIEARNLISGNGEQGMSLVNIRMSLIQGNYIGVDRTGTFAIPNHNDAGIGLYKCVSNVIGGSVIGAGNLIAGNTGSGIYCQDGGTNKILGNWIGVQAGGLLGIPNSLHNVVIEGSSGNLVGGVADGEGNVIAFTSGAGYDGVRVRSWFDGTKTINSTGNAIRGNSIFGNNGLGIDLEVDGVTLNDTGDADTGSNLQQNFPVLTTISGRYISVVKGTLNSKPNTTYLIDFYGNKATDTTGYGEGQLWLGFTSARTDSGGNVSFTVTLTNTVSVGQYITATATDPANNTSEFGLNISAAISIDNDHDLIPDDYESIYGFSATDASDAQKDFDGDGANNLAEFLAGTNPKDASDTLKLEQFKKLAKGMTMGFPTALGKKYRVEYSSTFGTNWTVLMDNIRGTGNITQVTDSSESAEGLRFYRVIVSDQ